MESPHQVTMVEAPIARPQGAAVPPLLDARLASLMFRFSQLTPHGQKRYMALLNDYLYASPLQRRQLRQAWEALLAQPCGDADDARHWMRAPRRKGRP